MTIIMWNQLKLEKDYRVVKEFINLMAENPTTNNQDIEYNLGLARDIIKQMDKEIEKIEEQIEKEKIRKLNEDPKQRVKLSWLKRFKELEKK